MFRIEGLTDTGIAERMTVDGVAGIHGLGDGTFVTVYWAWTEAGFQDGTPLFVKAPKLLLRRPCHSLVGIGSFAESLNAQTAGAVRMLHN